MNFPSYVVYVDDADVGVVVGASAYVNVDFGADADAGVEGATSDDDVDDVGYVDEDVG